jgi:acyl carrier protein
MDEAKRLLAEALRIRIEGISDDTKIQELPMWDSLGHMALIVLVEERINVTLSIDDIMAMTSVRGLAAVLESKRPKS